MLGSELFVGVIIALYKDVEAIKSPRVFSVLEPIFRDFSPQERDLLIRDMLELNHKTYSYNEIFQEIVNDDSPIDSSVHSNMDDGPDAKSTSWAHIYPVVTLAGSQC